MRKIVFLISALVISVTVMAEDHVMAATKSSDGKKSAPEVMNLSLKDAQE